MAGAGGGRKLHAVWSSYKRFNDDLNNVRGECLGCQEKIAGVVGNKGMGSKCVEG